MYCSKAKYLLQFYIDKQLTLDQIRALESHLSACHSCRQELLILEEIGQAISRMKLVQEPVDLTMNIMRRVSLSARQIEERTKEQTFELFRPSLLELLSVVLLATVAMLGIVLMQANIRATLPGINGNNNLSFFISNFWNVFDTMNSQTIMTGIWVIGTVLGIWITLVVAGADIRSEWFKAVMDRLPVW